jgi:Protein of unknown function (DUF732)
MKLSHVVSAAAAVAAVALASAPVASAGPDEDFLQYIAANGITWPAGKDQQVVDTGHAVCADWKNGATFQQEYQDLKDVTGWDDNKIGTFIGAATGAFCPQYKSKVS